MAPPPHDDQPHNAHPDEPHKGRDADLLNKLRAAVLGANDGIVSTAGIVVGVAAANPANTAAILIAGVAGLAAGAFSMAAGEYVSVSTQRDTEEALLAKERRELETEPEAELEELTQLYVAKGIERPLAEKVAAQLTEKDALRAHADIELHIDPDDLTSPWNAALASLVSFSLGALVPLLFILLMPVNSRIPATFAAAVAALLVTGWASARLGGAPTRPAMIRNAVGGSLAMIATYIIGTITGQQVH